MKTKELESYELKGKTYRIGDSVMTTYTPQIKGKITKIVGNGEADAVNAVTIGELDYSIGSDFIVHRVKNAITIGARISPEMIERLNKMR